MTKLTLYLRNDVTSVTITTVVAAAAAKKEEEEAYIKDAVNFVVGCCQRHTQPVAQ